MSARVKAAPPAQALAYDHLAEIESLATDCIEKAIELHPDFDEGRSAAKRDALHFHLLIHLRAIQHEAEKLRKAGAT